MIKTRDEIAAYLYKCFGTWKESNYWDLSELNKQGWLQYADDIIIIVKEVK